MNLNKQENETPLQYHKRLVYGKLVDKTLADLDYSELSKLIYGKEYSSDVARRMCYGSKRTLELMDDDGLSDADETVLNKLDAKTIEMKKEQQKFYDQRNAFNKIMRERSRQEEINEILTNAIQNSNLPPLNFVRTNISTSNKDLLVSLNDIHYGIEVHNAWNDFNSSICASMMRDYLNSILDIAKTHNVENCIVYNCGDSISGKIHTTVQIANKENVIEQIKGVSELISEFLAELSQHFNKIKYVSVAGNHSRLDKIDNSPYDERMDDLIEWYLEARLQHFENIEICSHNRIDPTIFLIDIRGKTYCGVHGDFDGSDSKIQTLQTMAQKPLYAILSGHLHHCKTDVVQGVRTIMSGSFLGMDDYCVQRRIYGKPEQIVCVCDESGIICNYAIPLSGCN